MVLEETVLDFDGAIIQFYIVLCGGIKILHLRCRTKHDSIETRIICMAGKKLGRKREVFLLFKGYLYLPFPTERIVNCLQRSDNIFCYSTATSIQYQSSSLLCVPIDNDKLAAIA
uniref:Uncharacterized protein n=1 Tax=Romanomermis culicivorax TaxID=13658 RepID=A0A915KRG2_ROMCU